MWDMCQMLNIWHISHTKQENQLLVIYCKCCKIIPFVSVPLQICNGTDKCDKPKIIILLDFDVVAVVDDNENVIIYYFNM